MQRIRMKMKKGSYFDWKINKIYEREVDRYGLFLWNNLSGRPLRCISFKLQQIEVKPILHLCLLFHQFSKLICIVNNLKK
jgi:hypothetical protein